jgi:hypothetical protein
MYSCRLDQEATSKLLIVDPFGLVIKLKTFSKQFDDRRLRSRNTDIQLDVARNISSRFSYRDLLLFTSIASVVSASGADGSIVKFPPQICAHDPISQADVTFLRAMGFSLEQSSTALKRYNGCVAQAAYALCEAYYRRWEQQYATIATLATAQMKGHHLAQAATSNHIDQV